MCSKNCLSLFSVQQLNRPRLSTKAFSSFFSANRRKINQKFLVGRLLANQMKSLQSSEKCQNWRFNINVSLILTTSDRLWNLICKFYAQKFAYSKLSFSTIELIQRKNSNVITPEFHFPSQTKPNECELFRKGFTKERKTNSYK